MKVSVLIPYYNDANFLGKAIESVLNQTYSDFELILVNHATTDNCREIAHSYKDPRIIHIDMDKNYGAGTGLITERFLEKASGDYVKPFCANDIMYPNCLEDLVNYMLSHPEKDFAFGDVEYIDQNGNSKNKTWFTRRKNFSLQNDEIACLKLFFYKGASFLPYIGSIIKADAMKSVKLDKSFIALYDMTLWISLLLKGYKIGYINKQVAGYRVHDGQASSCKNSKRIDKCVELEAYKYIERFLNSDNIELLKKLFCNNAYLQRTTDITPFDMKFITSYEMLFADLCGYKQAGYAYIYDLLQNDDTEKYLENKFGFGIKEFRAVYSTLDFSCAPLYSDFSFKLILFL